MNLWAMGMGSERKTIVLMRRINGTRYFTCPNKYAVFVRADKLSMGEYPEKDIMDDDDEDEI